MYRITKTYGHELGLSCCFRQWRADSHCRFLHGYPLSFKFEFGASRLDERGWVLDFGALKPLKEKLVELFDHKLAVAGDDPMLDDFMYLNHHQMADVMVHPDGVGCEKFAKRAFFAAVETLSKIDNSGRVKVMSCECAEHGGNSAIYFE